MASYYTDREYGLRSRIVDGIDVRVWGGLHSLIETRLGNGSFGWRFPAQCPDGYGPYGCDERVFVRTLMAEVPWINWPADPSSPPEAPVVFDLLEFCARAVGEPIQQGYHSYFQHHHLIWDRATGLSRFVADVNLVFARNGVAYELSADGQARRLLPQLLADTLISTLFKTGDAETDRLLEVARRSIVSTKPDERRDALEKLWDAFERLKTLESGRDKRSQADALLDRVAPPGTQMRQMLAEEAMALTAIGNRFRIRHSETGQEIITIAEHVDYLFSRMFAFVRLLLRMSGRGG